MKVPLAKDPNYHPDHRPQFRALHVVKADAFWTSVRGTLIHRARFARIYPHQGGRVCVQYWCGNSGNSAIPFRPECGEGKSPCQTCERKYQKRRQTDDER